MHLSKKIQILCISLATFLLSFCCFSHGLVLKGSVALIIGILWLYGLKRNLNLIASLWMILLIIIASSCIVSEISVAWMLLTVIAAIYAWDLDWFVRRINNAVHVEKIQQMEQHHLKRLLIITAISFILSMVTLNLEFSFNFFWMLFLALIAAFCMERLFAFFMSENN